MKKKTKKTPFFIKAKNAIFNFDKYQSFAEEKISSAIKYFLKLDAIFVLVLVIIGIINLINVCNEAISVYSNEFPNFKFENNCLVIEDENKEFIKTDTKEQFAIIVNSEEENIEEFDDIYAKVKIVLLKDKIVTKGLDGTSVSVSYKDINDKYPIEELNKEKVMEIINNGNLSGIYFMICIISFISLYIRYLIIFIIDIIFLSLIGLIISRIIDVRFKYKVIFNMSVYSITLSVVLLLIYTVVNMFTEFSINKFELAYNAIAYVYLITAMLMIKAELIKQQKELSKIIEEQKKVNKENEEEEKEETKKEQEDDKEDNPIKSKKEKSKGQTANPAEN